MTTREMIGEQPAVAIKATLRVRMGNHDAHYGGTSCHLGHNLGNEDVSV